MTFGKGSCDANIQTNNLSLQQKTAAQHSRDSSENTFLRNEKKIAANSPKQMPENVLLLMLLKN